MIHPKGKWIPGRTCTCSATVGEEKMLPFPVLPLNYLLSLPICFLSGRKGANKGGRKAWVKNTLLLSLLLVWSLEAVVGKSDTLREKILTPMFKSSPSISTSLDSLKVNVSERQKEWKREISLLLCSCPSAFEYSTEQMFWFNPFSSLTFLSLVYFFY